MTTEVPAGVLEVTGAMQQLVEKDGGRLEIVEYVSTAGVLRVNYLTGTNDDCSTCSITHEMMRDFLLEGIRSHSIDIHTVEVGGA